MKISTNTRYALRFLARLAVCEEGRLTTASVAAAENISEKMLERIAAKLKREGFVASSRGIGGGYSLAVPAQEITVTRIIRVMETPYLPLHCSGEEDCCGAGGIECAIYRMFLQVDRAITEVTDRVTIADLAREGTENREGAF